MTTITNNQQTHGCADNCPTDAVTFSPRFDVWETADEVVLSGDFPGVTSDDLDLQFEEDQLTIRGRVAARNDGRKSLGSEYGVGDFHRAFTIGESIDVTEIRAELAGGVLTVHLPKRDRVKTRKIEVRTE